MRLRLLEDAPGRVMKWVRLLVRDGLRDCVLLRGDGEMGNGEDFNIGAAGQKVGSRTVPGKRSRVLSAAPEDLDALLLAHCRDAVTELPRGVLGTATAAEFLAALPAACRLLLPDITGSGPAMFSVLVSHRLLPAMPSPRVLPAALALAATVSPLLERRSARQWTMWLARVRERDSAVAVAVHARTPDSQRSAIAAPMSSRPLRSAALRAERDMLAEQLALAQAEAGKYRAELAAEQERQAARQDGWAAKDRELNARLDRLQQKMAEMGRTLEAASATQAQGRADLAEIRRLCGVASDDPRTVGQLIGAVMRTLGEVENDEAAARRALAGAVAERDKLAARIERAENDLARARADLAAAKNSLKMQTERGDQRVGPMLEHLHGLELELGQAVAENELRRGRMLPPSEHDVLTVRQEAARKVRQLQSKRTLPWQED